MARDNDHPRHDPDLFCGFFNTWTPTPEVKVMETTALVL